MITPIDIGSIGVALIAAGGAWASQRSASKATNINTMVNARIEAEKDAYERARAFDTETIRRQNEEIRDLRAEVSKCRERIAVLEHGHPSSLERMLLERLDEDSSDQK